MLKKYSIHLFVIIIPLYLATEPTKRTESRAESATTEELKISDVIDLTDETDFDAAISAISRYSVILVEFYTPWCGICKRLAPEYENAAKQLKSNDPPVILAKFDCSSQPSGEPKCRELGLKGVPTLKIYKNGTYYYDYSGALNATSIVEYMNEIIYGDPAKQFQTAEELDTPLTNASNVTVLGLFEQSCKTGPIFKDFQSAADKYRNTIEFLRVFVEKVTDAKSINILKEFFSKNIETKLCYVIIVRPVHMRNKFEPDYVVYTSGDINEFIRLNKHGLVGHKTYDNKLDFDLPIVNVYYEINNERNQQKTKYWRNRVLKVAVKHRDLTFVIADKIAFDLEVERFGLERPKTGDPEPIVCARKKLGYRFAMKENFSVEAFEKFVDDFKTGKLVPFVRSQELPADVNNSADDVKILVANNFEDMVLNVDKDHLILFYNPIDDYFKVIDPFYKKLGQLMRNEPDVQISKIDRTANDILTLFPHRKFSTIYWYSRNKTVTLYSGELRLKDLIEFVAKHATSQLIGYDRVGNSVVINQKHEL